MPGYHNENYPGNSKEILKSWKYGTQNFKMPGPFAYLVCILNTFTPQTTSLIAKAEALKDFIT
jgi:hypothetical protein